MSSSNASRSPFLRALLKSFHCCAMASRANLYVGTVLPVCITSEIGQGHLGPRDWMEHDRAVLPGQPDQDAVSPLLHADDHVRLGPEQTDHPLVMWHVPGRAVSDQ